MEGLAACSRAEAISASACLASSAVGPNPYIGPRGTVFLLGRCEQSVRELIIQNRERNKDSRSHEKNNDGQQRWSAMRPRNALDLLRGQARGRRHLVSRPTSRGAELIIVPQRLWRGATWLAGGVSQRVCLRRRREVVEAGTRAQIAPRLD